jgi:type IV pilus assembly protein PilA
MINTLKGKIKEQKGFTLIEVLLVVAIIAILAGIVILAVNPGKQLGDTRNSERRADVNTILNAVYQYSIDNQGNLPSSITTTTTDICATGASSCTGLVDLSVLAANGKYLVAIPSDPQTGTATDTHYQIAKDANGRVTVSAPSAEQGVTISATR